VKSTVVFVRRRVTHPISQQSIIEGVCRGLIIAAGEGSRFAPKHDTKPLVKLLGLPLIERVILTAKEAGLSDFYIVTGHHGRTLKICFILKIQMRLT